MGRVKFIQKKKKKKKKKKKHLLFKGDFPFCIYCLGGYFCNCLEGCFSNYNAYCQLMHTRWGTGFQIALDPKRSGVCIMHIFFHWPT